MTPKLNNFVHVQGLASRQLHNDGKERSSRTMPINGKVRKSWSKGRDGIISGVVGEVRIQDQPGRWAEARRDST